jgi:hypothetical protein
MCWERSYHFFVVYRQFCHSNFTLSLQTNHYSLCILIVNVVDFFRCV